MKKLLLETKWVGALAVILFALVVSYYVSGWASTFIKQVRPTVVAELSEFLPITLENGEIVNPQGAYIRKTYGKTYGPQNMPINIVLDTRSDSLSSDEIREQGLYVSRKYIYAVSKQKTEIRSFEDMPNATIDRQLLEAGADWLEQNAGIYIFGTLFLSLALIMALASLIYAALIQLLIGKMIKVNFARTLRVTTLGYVALAIFGMAVFSVGMIVKFVLLLAANYGVAKYVPQSA